MTNPLRFTVAFDEADGENIVFFGNYFRMAHRAFEAWLPTRGIGWATWFASPDHGVPLLHAEADYAKSLRPGDVYLVEISVARLGDSSVHFEYAFTSESGQPLARLKTSHVFLSRRDMKKMSIPGALRAALAGSAT